MWGRPTLSSRSWSSTFAAAFAAALVVSDAGVARADAKTAEQCATASEQAQLLRLKGRLVSARRELVTCSRATCPAVVRKDCDRWLGEVDEELPSIVISARDENGDVRDFQVTIDGVPMERVEGRAIPIDPGPHDVQVEVGGHPPSRQSIIVREGQKRRAVEVTFGEKKEASPASPPPPTPSRDAGNGMHVLGWSLVGLGVVGAAAGTYFAVRQASAYDDARSCAPICPLDRKNEIDSLRLVEGVAFSVAGVALVTGVIILVTRPTKSAASYVTPRLGFAF